MDNTFNTSNISDIKHNTNYTSYLNSTNDFTKVSKSDISEILKINLDDLKTECFEFNMKDSAVKNMNELFLADKLSKLDKLQKYFDGQVKLINDEYESNVKTNQVIEPSNYVNRQTVLQYFDDFIAYKKDTDKLLKSFDTCRAALKNDQMNDTFITQLKTEKMDAFMNKSLFVKGLIHYLKNENIPLKCNITNDSELKFLKESELAYCVPYNMQTYENFVQYDDVRSDTKSTNEFYLKFNHDFKDAKPEDFNKPILNSQLLSTDNLLYKTPYSDINTTYQSVVVPTNIDEHLIQARGSLLETGSNMKSSSTDYWLLQTALMN